MKMERDFIVHEIRNDCLHIDPFNFQKVALTGISSEERKDRRSQKCESGFGPLRSWRLSSRTERDVHCRLEAVLQAETTQIFIHASHAHRAQTHSHTSRARAAADWNCS